jgi:hypothetical protein
MIVWIDEPTWVLIETDLLDVHMSDGVVKRRQFRADGDELDPHVPGLEPTQRMREAWSRFCARMGRGS